MSTRLAPGDFPLEPALDFLQHLWALNHAMERVSLQMEKRLGVTAQQRLVLRCVGKYPGITGSQLAALLHLDRGTVSTSLHRLEASGVVSKRKEPGDSRRVALGLTTKGKALDRPTRATVEYAVDRVLAQLPPRQLARVKDTLRKLTAELNASLPAAPPRPKKGRPAGARSAG